MVVESGGDFAYIDSSNAIVAIAYNYAFDIIIFIS